MSKRIYRICLIIVLLAALATAIIWYQNCRGEKMDGEGLLVKVEQEEISRVKEQNGIQREQSGMGERNLAKGRWDDTADTLY